MDKIFYTKGNGFSIITVYRVDCAKFQTLIEYDKGTKEVLESFKDPKDVLTTHEHWCRFTGLLKSSFNPCQVKKHLTSIA